MTVSYSSNNVHTKVTTVTTTVVHGVVVGEVVIIIGSLLLSTYGSDRACRPVVHWCLLAKNEVGKYCTVVVHYCRLQPSAFNNIIIITLHRKVQFTENEKRLHAFLPIKYDYVLYSKYYSGAEMNDYRNEKIWGLLDSSWA